MKKFILAVLCVSTFFIGLGGLIENVGAKFKSDERALEIMRRARQAIGGDANLNAVQSLSVTGKVTKTLNFGEETRTETGDWELNLQASGKISKMIKIGAGVGSGGEQLEKKVNVVVVRKGDGAKAVIGEDGSSEKVTIIKKGDGEMPSEKGDGTPKIRRQILTENIHGDVGNNHGDDFFRTMMFLLLTAPQNTDANYVYAGDGVVDGANCEIVQISSNGGSLKLYFNKSTHLPVMASFTGAKPLVFRVKPGEANADGKANVMVFANQKGAAQTGEFQIKFSDYRNVNGVQFPHRWTQTIDNSADETIDVTGYEVNPANIADKFKNEPQKIMIRTKKPE